MAVKQLGKKILLDTGDASIHNYFKQKHPEFDVVLSPLLKLAKSFNGEPPSWLSKAALSNLPLKESVVAELAALRKKLSMSDLGHMGREPNYNELSNRKSLIHKIYSGAYTDAGPAKALLERMDIADFGKMVPHQYYVERRGMVNDLQRLETKFSLMQGDDGLSLRELVARTLSFKQYQQIGMVVSFQAHWGMWPVIYAYKMPKNPKVDGEFFRKAASECNYYLCADVQQFNPKLTQIPQELVSAKVPTLICFAREIDVPRLLPGIVKIAQSIYKLETPLQ